MGLESDAAHDNHTVEMVSCRHFTGPGPHGFYLFIHLLEAESWLLSFSRKSFLSTTLDYKRFNKINELGGSDPQLQINLTTSQPEKIRFQFCNRFIQDHLQKPSICLTTYS